MPPELTIESLAEEGWFPSGVATAIEPAAEQAPTGFEAYRLHTRWGSHLMLWPTGDSDSLDWWKRMLPAGGGGERWGDAPDLTGARVERIESWDGRCWRIREAGGRSLRAQFLPLDSNGHGRRLAELDSESLESAIGGLQWQGRDVLLILREQIGEVASEQLSIALGEQDTDAAERICQTAGEALGRFHVDALQRLALPNDQQRWNDRLKMLEERLVTNTLWRAPHSRDTHATITHRNFGLEAVLLHADEQPTIGCCADGVVNALLPPFAEVAAVRDVAAAYRSISRVLADAEVRSSETGTGLLADLDQPATPEFPADLDQPATPEFPADLELRLRQALFTGWASTAPPTARSAVALDGHRGGVAIWEYEQVLEEVSCALAWQKAVPARLIDWLAFVPHLQTSMYHSRTLSGLSLVCGTAAAIMLFLPGEYTLTTRIGSVLALTAAGISLRWLYRQRAPPPY